MSDEGDQGRSVQPGAPVYGRPTRAMQPVQGVRRSIVPLVRSWVRGGIVTNANQVSAELNHRAVPLLKGKKG